MTSNVDFIVGDLECMSQAEADDNNNPNINRVKTASLLRKAIERLDVREVEEILKRDFDVENNALDDDRNYTALHVLVLTITSTERQNRLSNSNAKFIDILSILIQYSVDINKRDINKQTPLHLAAAKPCNSDILKVLISHGADINMADNLSQTALHKSASTGTLYDMKALLESGIDPNALDISGRSALHIACKRLNNSPVVDLLLQHGAKVNIRDLDPKKQGIAPLHVACRYGNLDSVVTLLRGGCRVDVVDTSGQTCVHMAAAHDVTGKVIPWLVEHRADVNAQDFLYQDTPLHKAVKHQMFENIKSLLRARANPAIPDCRRNSVLHVAASTLKDIFSWTLLMKTGVSMHAKNAEHLSPLEKAIRSRNSVAVNVMHQYDVVASPKMSASPRLSHRSSVNYF